MKVVEVSDSFFLDVFLVVVVAVFSLFIFLSETDRDFTASGLFLLLSDAQASRV
jgi:hypothetical protein